MSSCQSGLRKTALRLGVALMASAIRLRWSLIVARQLLDRFSGWLFHLRRCASSTAMRLASSRFSLLPTSSISSATINDQRKRILRSPSRQRRPQGRLSQSVLAGRHLARRPKPSPHGDRSRGGRLAGILPVDDGTGGGARNCRPSDVREGRRRPALRPQAGGTSRRRRGRPDRGSNLVVVRARQASVALNETDRLQRRHVLMNALEVPAEIARERADVTAGVLCRRRSSSQRFSVMCEANADQERKVTLSSASTVSPRSARRQAFAARSAAP